MVIFDFGNCLGGLHFSGDIDFIAFTLRDEV
jgi:hypothetical protein